MLIITRADSPGSFAAVFIRPGPNFPFHPGNGLITVEWLPQSGEAISPERDVIRVANARRGRRPANGPPEKNGSGNGNAIEETAINLQKMVFR